MRNGAPPDNSVKTSLDQPTPRIITSPYIIIIRQGITDTAPKSALVKALSGGGLLSTKDPTGMCHQHG